jgi:ParB-like chromosome segregation protein Spo0J
METAIGTFQVDKDAAFTPKLGEVRTIDIFSSERRKIREKTVTDLVEDLARDRRFLHPIAVRDEGATGYRLIAGHHRLEAWKRQFGERQPIEAVIFPSHTPDARITALETGENLHRKDLTAAERQAGLLRYAAARKELEHGNPVTSVSGSGQGPKSGTASPSLPPARGGRGNKGMARKIAEELGIDKRSVNRDLEAASVAIDEPIDLYRDTPEELQRKAAELEKADTRQRAEPKVGRPKPRKPAPRVEDATPPAEPHAGETGSKIEVARSHRHLAALCSTSFLKPDQTSGLLYSS